MHPSENPELTFAADLSAKLSPYGSAELQYISAEFQPFSNAQRPDVLFRPKSGPYLNNSIFIQIKLDAYPIDRHQIDMLLEHWTFAKEYLGREISCFVLVTKIPLPELTNRNLQKNGIVVIEQVDSADEAVAALITRMSVT